MYFSDFNRHLFRRSLPVQQADDFNCAPVQLHQAALRKDQDQTIIVKGFEVNIFG
jgi:hypothetical protein